MTSRRAFVVFNYTFLILLALLSVLPLVQLLAVSFSTSAAADAGLVTLWPVGLTGAAYQYALSSPQFLTSLGVSLKRVVLGTAVNMVLTTLIAYALSKEPAAFRWRTVYVWFFVLTMLFQGGLIPLYMVVRGTGLLDTLWALILPRAVLVFNVVLLLNFFRGLPKELEEAALVDGAGHWTVLWRIYLPLSTPALATVGLLTMVMHWNAWFDGIVFMNSPSNYPLQSYLQTVIVERAVVVFAGPDLELLRQVSNRTFQAAQIFLAALPILAVYPLLQRYFVKGIVLGSVKQ